MPAGFRSFIVALSLTSGFACIGSAVADEVPFTVEQKGVCEYASDKSHVSQSLRSLYSCKHKMVIIRNTSDKTLVFDKIVINQNKCRNHLFMDGESEGPVKPDGKVVFATSCKLSRIDLRVDRDEYYHTF